MSDTRERILVNIQTALGRGPLSGDVRSKLGSRINEPEQGIRPGFDQDPADRFIEKLEAVAGTSTRVSGMHEVPAAIQSYLDRHQIEASIVMSGHPTLARIGWPEAWQIETRPARGEDRVSITVAFAGIAETGTLAFLSGPTDPTTLNFLPDDHIVVIQVGQIMPHLEDLWGLMRKQVPRLPRTVNLVTGPSRTADVEQTIQLGAHGPRRLHVVLVEERSVE